MAQVLISEEDGIVLLSWRGDYSNAVRKSNELAFPPTHQEGESSVAFPAPVEVTQEGSSTRYRLPSGAVFILRGDLLTMEGE